MGYIKPENAWDFFQKVLKNHKKTFGRSKQIIKTRVYKLEQLTPGDFKTVVRKLSLTDGGVSVLGLVEGLEEEVRERSLSRRRQIGFSAVY